MCLSCAPAASPHWKLAVLRQKKTTQAWTSSHPSCCPPPRPPPLDPSSPGSSTTPPPRPTARAQGKAAILCPALDNSLPSLVCSIICWRLLYIRNIFLLQIFSWFWTRWGNSRWLNFAVLGMYSLMNCHILKWKFSCGLTHEICEIKPLRK